MEHPLASWLVAAGVLAGAVLAHWTLVRVGRRLPVLLARRASRNGGAFRPARYSRWVDAALVLPKLALWLAALDWLTRNVAPLVLPRDVCLSFVRTSLTTPIFTLNDTGYSALDVLVLPAALGGLWLAVTAFTRGVQATLLSALGVDRGAQEVFGVLVRYALVFLGGIVILQGWGIDVRALAIVASVLGVGIGFGLQNIANNFVSGLLLSLERPIKPGDWVNVGQFTGTVVRIGARSTQIRTSDHVTILVPNSRLLENEVVNWSHGDPVSRVRIPVIVDGETNLGALRRTLLGVTVGHPDVLADPRPRVALKGFEGGDLRVELRVWIADPRVQSRVKSDLHFRIAAAFRRDGIALQAERRDVQLRAPALEGVVHAWAARALPPTMLPPAPPAPANGDGGAPYEEDLGPRAWSTARLLDVARRMRGTGGVALRDRRHLFSVHPMCFVGREAVDWLAAREGLSRDEAVTLGRVLVERGVVRHVLDEHGFEDAHLFYRFEDDPAGRSDGQLDGSAGGAGGQ